jgi:hypothetical protein
MPEDRRNEDKEGRLNEDLSPITLTFHPLTHSSNSHLDICAWMVYITTNMTHQPAYTVYFYFYGKPDPAAVGGA